MTRKLSYLYIFFLLLFFILGLAFFAPNVFADTRPPGLDVYSYFDDNNNPQSITLYGSYNGGVDGAVCNVDQYLDSYAYTLVDLSSDTWGNVTDISVVPPSGHDGFCNDVLEWGYHYEQIINVSGLAAGDYTVQMQAMNSIYQWSFANVNFHINRSNPVNGSCASTHYNCSGGSLGASAEYSDQWQWWCNGSGGSTVNVLCTESKSVNGGWGGWGSCNASCGGGTQYRSCDSPAPSNGGDYCSGSDSQSCNPQSCNGAQYISQSVPATMYVGQPYAVSVTMKNTGYSIWTAGTNYKLGAQNPWDNNIWGVGITKGRVVVPGNVYPNGQVTFSFTVTAPSSIGTYNFQWRMLKEDVEWFGDFTANLSVSVVNAPINCVGGWGACSGGSQTYTITTNAAYGGSVCSYSNGATQACGTAASWSGWGTCSGGSQSGTCTQASGGGAPTCATITPGDPHTAGTNTRACGIASSWSGWGACSGGSQSGTCTEATGGGAPTCATRGYSAGTNTQTCGTPASWSGYNACSGGDQTGTCTEATGGGAPTCATITPGDPHTAGVNHHACGQPGVCAATHYNCTSPTASTNNSNNTTTWTWTCPGSGGGTNAPCTQTKAMSGTLTASNCSITLGNSSCNSTLVWTTTDAEATSAVTTPTSITVATGNSGTTTYPVANGYRTFYLYNNNKLLTQATAAATCVSGTGWDTVSGTCKTSINGGWTTPWGACSVTANCAIGTQARTCTNPARAYGGADCVGSATQSCSAPCVGMSGTLTGSACTITTSGASSCTTNLSWGITFPEATPTAITSNSVGAPFNLPAVNATVTNTLSTPQSGTQSVTVPKGGRTFYLYNNTKSLVPTSPAGSGVTISAICDPSLNWTGSYCTAGTIVDGDWTDWSTCSAVTCGAQGTQTRTCTPPQNGGLPCSSIDGGNSSQTCTAPIGVTVTVEKTGHPVVPSVSALTITKGDPVTLKWFSCASTCTGENFDTGGLSGGSVPVNPTATTIYTARCTNYHF